MGADGRMDAAPSQYTLLTCCTRTPLFLVAPRADARQIAAALRHTRAEGASRTGSEQLTVLCVEVFSVTSVAYTAFSHTVEIWHKSK